MTRRWYPMACRSLYCGSTGADCAGCPELPAREAFEAWRRETQARQPDPIWSPGLWEATRPLPLPAPQDGEVEL